MIWPVGHNRHDPSLACVRYDGHSPRLPEKPWKTRAVGETWTPSPANDTTKNAALIVRYNRFSHSVALTIDTRANYYIPRQQHSVSQNT